METIAYPLRIPQEVIALAKLRSKEEYVDQSTALRQLLYIGAEEYVLEMVQKGRISTGKAAELLNTTVYDIQRLAEKHHIELGPTHEQQLKSKNTMDKLIKKKP